VAAAPVATTILRVVRRATPATLAGVAGAPTIASASPTKLNFGEDCQVSSGLNISDSEMTSMGTTKSFFMDLLLSVF